MNKRYGWVKVQTTSTSYDRKTSSSSLMVDMDMTHKFQSLSYSTYPACFIVSFNGPHIRIDTHIRGSWYSDLLLGSRETSRSTGEPRQDLSYVYILQPPPTPQRK